METKPKDIYTAAKVSPERKKRVRVLAAHKGTSMADFAGDLLALGLAAYEETHGLPPESIRAKSDTAA